VEETRSLQVCLEHLLQELILEEDFSQGRNQKKTKTQEVYLEDLLLAMEGLLTLISQRILHQLVFLAVPVQSQNRRAHCLVEE